MKAHAIEFDSVSLARGGVPVLQDLNLSLPAREVSAVLGESGSGKSTLVQLAIGLLRPDEGRVRTLGQLIDPATIRPLRRRIGYAVQDVALFPHLTVRDNILLPARLAGRDAQQSEQRLAELLQLLQLPGELLDRWPHELSGGQQQRAGLCRAMILRPELLLLDEPFSGLDTLTRHGIHERFAALQSAEPIASVLVTHDPQEAVNLASYLVVLRDGRVAQQGPVAEVIARPADEYVDRLCRALPGIET